MRATWAAFVVTIAFAAAPDAGADARRGEALYESLCATCHGPGRAPGSGPISGGAGRPEVILSALANVPEMGVLTRLLSATDVADIAEFLAELFGGEPPPPPPPPAGTTTVVEYLHAGFGHYFVTGIAGEIAALDTGQVAGWVRTGKSFKGFEAGGPERAAVCRFFTETFAPRSSHFYTPLAVECNGLRDGSATWQYEGETFFVRLSDSAGACPAGTEPVYRLYNDGRTGAPNHRYTTDRDVRAEMVAQGYVPEGFGDDGVAFCAPVESVTAQR